MKNFSCLFCKLFICLILFSSSHIFANNKLSNGIEYISPVPNSILNNIHTSIIFRLSSPVQDLNNLNLSLEGNLNGNYSFNIKVADDGRTIILQPSSPFSLAEEVSLVIPTIKLRSGDMTVPYTLVFHTQKVSVHDAGIGLESISEANKSLNASPPGFAPLPSDFPPISVTASNDPSPGGIFLSNFPIAIPNDNIGNYLMILDYNGFPYYYKKLNTNGADFKMLPNGNLVYYKQNGNYYEMDNNFNVVDSFYTVNGYSTDIHEFQMLEDGSYYIMSYDPEILNMSEIIPGGGSGVHVTGGIIQKFDAHKNLVFQWRSWDGYQITDATHENLYSLNIDYTHINAIDPLPDGNILISSRHMDEITKINTQTGEIIWRMGGKNNQFKFINDSLGFSHQHAIRMLPNGNITLFDNGNFHSPTFSRAVEYKLDEKNKTVELVWQFRNSPDNHAFAMGYVQRLSNGNTLIGWGASNPSVTEVTPDGTKVLELSFPQPWVSYRAYKFDWNRYVSTAIPSDYYLEQNFPNPFNPSTTLRFELLNPGRAKLFVSDILGKQVAVLVDKDLLTGTYEYTFNAGNLSSGIYFYTLSSGGRIITKRMMLIK